MIRGTSMPRQALPMLAAAALLLPAIIALAVWFSAQQGERRSGVETQALESARKVAALAEAEITANMRVLTVMAGSPVLQGGHYESYRDRAARVVRDNPD
jgi:hypothetical protein